MQGNSPIIKALNSAFSMSCCIHQVLNKQWNISNKILRTTWRTIKVTDRNLRSGNQNQWMCWSSTSGNPSNNTKTSIFIHLYVKDNMWFGMWLRVFVWRADKGKVLKARWSGQYKPSKEQALFKRQKHLIIWLSGTKTLYPGGWYQEPPIKQWICRRCCILLISNGQELLIVHHISASSPEIVIRITYNSISGEQV